MWPILAHRLEISQTGNVSEANNPGSVIGMLIPFFGLYSGVIKLDMISKVSDFFLENLAFFFLPAGVSLITCFALLEGKWIAILTVSLVSTVVTLAVAGFTVELFKRSLAKKPAEEAFGKEMKIRKVIK